MTTPLEVQQRAAAGEDSYTEFKAALEHPDKIAAEIVAFVNAEGGKIFFGVDDLGNIVGLAQPRKAEETLMNICRQNCIPAVRPLVQFVETNGKIVLVLEVRGPDRPYKTNRGVYYIRVGSTKREATQRELMRIFQRARAIYHDEQPVLDTGLDDLDLPFFESYYQKQFDGTLEEAGVVLPDLLRSMKLLTEQNGTLLFTVAGLLLFGKDPQRHLPYTRLSAVRFADTEVSERMDDRKEITGTLSQIIDQVLLFIRRNIRVAARIEGFRREDVPQYDEIALREAVVNAVAHRDYSLTGSQIRLFIFDDRIEVRSPGRLPNTVTLENIKVGVHAERNPRICTVLTHLGYMSDIGTGIPRLIIRLTKRLSGREPEFELFDEEFWVRIWGRSP